MFRRHFGGLTDNATLADFANVTMGQSPAGSSYNEAGIGTIFYQGRAEFGWRYPTQRLSTTEPKRMAKAGDVLMSVRAPVGDLNLAYEDCCIGRGLAAIHCDYPSYGLYLMRSLHKKLDAYNGEGTVFGSINGKALNGLPIALPNNAAIRAFEKEAAPIDAQIRNNEVESRTLVTLRDTLLPKLMSGEIDVSKVDLTQLNSHLAQIRKLNADCRICDVFPEPTIRRLYLISNLWRNESCFLLIIAYLFDRLSSIFDKMTYFLSNILDKMQSEYRAHEKAPSGYFRSGLR